MEANLLDSIDDRLTLLKTRQKEYEKIFTLAKNTKPIAYGDSNSYSKGLQYTQTKYALNRLIQKHQSARSTALRPSSVSAASVPLKTALVSRDPVMSKYADLMNKDFSSSSRTNKGNKENEGIESLIAKLDPNKFKTNYVYKKENKLASMERKKVSYARSKTDNQLMQMEEFLSEEMREMLQDKMQQISGDPVVDQIEGKIVDDMNVDSSSNAEKESEIDFGPNLNFLTIVFMRIPHKNYYYCVRYKERLMKDYGSKINLEYYQMCDEHADYTNTFLMDSRDPRTVQVIRQDTYQKLMAEVIGEHYYIFDYPPVLDYIYTILFKYSNKIFDYWCLHYSMKYLLFYLHLKDTFGWYDYNIDSFIPIKRKHFIKSMEEFPYSMKVLKYNENCSIEEHFNRIDKYKKNYVEFKQLLEYFIDRYIFIKITNKINRLYEGELDRQLKTISKNSMKEVELKYFKGKHVNLIKKNQKFTI